MKRLAAVIREAWDRYGCAIFFAALLLLGALVALVTGWPGGGK